MLRVYQGDFLLEESDATLLPVDPDIRFKQEYYGRAYAIQIDHLMKEVEQARKQG